MTLQEYTKLFVGGIAPIVLTDLWSFAQSLTPDQPFAEGFELITNEYTWSLYSQCSEFNQRVVPFAQADSSGSIYALWQSAQPMPLDQMPIVVFGSDGGQHVVAEHLPALLRLLSLDTEPIVDEDGVLYCRDEENYEPSPHSRAFRKWFRAHFQLCPISTNFEAEALVERAQTQYGQAFLHWLQPFLEPRFTSYN